MKILVTGAAGFIGSHLSQRLLGQNHEVIGFDNLNDYYDVNLKFARLKSLKEKANFEFIKADIADRQAVEQLFCKYDFDRVVHLAAQAGVRYSLTNPHAYVDSNLVGFVNILEGCRHAKTAHLVYASSSSVYGSNTVLPFSVHQNVDHPVSLYAATKKANELMAHTYAHLFRLPVTGLRFFTVYGPWGRPDMALFIFTKAIFAGKPIEVYNHGKMRRDFTYVDDVVEGIIRTMEKISQPNPQWDSAAADPSSSFAPYKVYNIGNHKPIELLEFIKILEAKIGKTVEKIMLPMQPGDVPATFADVDDLMKDVGFAPSTPLETGVARFVDWYKKYYHLG